MVLSVEAIGGFEGFGEIFGPGFCPTCETFGTGADLILFVGKLVSLELVALVTAADLAALLSNAVAIGLGVPASVTTGDVLP